MFVHFVERNGQKMVVWMSIVIGVIIILTGLGYIGWFKRRNAGEIEDGDDD